MVLRAILLSAGLVLALGAAAGGLPPSGDVPAHALTNCDTSEAALDTVEQEFVRLLNEERARNGAAPVAPAESLNRAAAWKSADQAAHGGLSHTDSLGRDPVTRIRDCGNAAPSWGENVLVGAATAQAAFDLWKTSAGHYQNMVNPAYAFVGVGRHGVYWTLDFSSTGDDGGTPPPTQPPAATATPTPSPVASPTPSPTPSSTPSPAPSPTPSPTEPPEPFTVVVPLFAGGNLVTYYGPPLPAAEAFAEIAGALGDAFRWDPATGWRYWSPVIPAGAAGFTFVGPGDVFYLRLDADVTWSYDVRDE